MKRNNRIRKNWELISVAFLSILSFSCIESKEEVWNEAFFSNQPHYLILNQNTISFTAEKSTSAEIVVQTEDKFECSSRANWLEVNLLNGRSFTITASPNKTLKRREGSVNVSVVGLSNGSIMQSVSVVQEAPYFKVNRESVQFKAEGGESEKISVTTNGTFKVVSNSKDWLNVKMLNDSEFTLIAEEHRNTASKREGTVIVSLDLTEGQRTHVIEVTQAAAINYGGGPSQYVDLGLSVKWAACNLGATQPYEYGSYFAWGETKVKENYSWSTYVFRTSGDTGDNICLSKYNNDKKYESRCTVDGKTTLDLSDDAAHILWGAGWRIPTEEEWKELFTKCTWTWTTHNGHTGYSITSNYNGKAIFIPSTGYYEETSLKNETNGWYWTSSLWESYFIYSVGVNFNGSNAPITNTRVRCRGLAVRPVHE